MQILYPFAGSIQQYAEQPSHCSHRPCACAMCGTKRPLRAHGFYRRWVSDGRFDGLVRVPRFLCLACRRTLSLLPEFVLPYLRSALTVVGLFLRARLLDRQTLKQSAATAGDPAMPYQRGQQWVRRFRRQAAALSGALSTLTSPPTAPDFITRALRMLETAGWVPAHRFLFARLRMHLLGWPAFLAPDGRRRTL